jgi:hypothetical protein
VNAASGAYNYEIDGYSVHGAVDATINNIVFTTNFVTSGIKSGYNNYVRPTFRPIVDFSNRFDPINRGLEYAGLPNAAAGYRGLKFAPARGFVSTIEGIGAIDGAVLRGAGNFAYKLGTDPRVAITSALVAVGNAPISIVESGIAAGLKLPGATRNTYANMTSGVPSRIELGYSTAGQAATALIPQGAALRIVGLEAKLAMAAERGAPLMRGIAFENAGVKAAQAEAFIGGQSVRRLSVRAFDDAGNLLPGRTVLDLAGTRVGTNQLGALEFKLHEGVSLTARQAELFPYLARNGGVVVGKNGQLLGLSNRAPIGPLDVQRINGPTLPQTWWPK